MNDIKEFAASAPNFYKLSAVDQILMFAWFLEARRSQASFSNKLMRDCFINAGLSPPDMSVYLPRLVSKKPPQLVKFKGEYRLSGDLRRDMDRRIGGDPVVLSVTRTLAELSLAVPDLNERDFLKETINCYQVKAYRATIVMMWNLAYDHISHWIFSDENKVSLLNASIAIRFPKKNLTLRAPEDLQELKESELLELLRTTNLLEKNKIQILKDKLNRRNMAAHPSHVVFTQHQADDMITDLISNIVLSVK